MGICVGHMTASQASAADGFRDAFNGRSPWQPPICIARSTPVGRARTDVLFDANPNGAGPARSERHSRSARGRAWKNEPVRSFGTRKLDITGLRGEESPSGAATVGRPLVGPLVPPGTDRLGSLELDELLEDGLS